MDMAWLMMTNLFPHLFTHTTYTHSTLPLPPRQAHTQHTQAHIFSNSKYDFTKHSSEISHYGQNAHAHKRLSDTPQGKKNTRGAINFLLRLAAKKIRKRMKYFMKKIQGARFFCLMMVVMNIVLTALYQRESEEG